MNLFCNITDILNVLTKLLIVGFGICIIKNIIDKTIDAISTIGYLILILICLLV